MTKIVKISAFISAEIYLQWAGLLYRAAWKTARSCIYNYKHDLAVYTPNNALLLSVFIAVVEFPRVVLVGPRGYNQGNKLLMPRPDSLPAL